jgi:hypothetical protein
LYQDTSLANAPLQSSDANVEDAFHVSVSSYVGGVLQSTSDLIVGSGVSVSEVSRVAAPEIDPAAAGSAATLLIGSLLVLRGRRAKLS